VRRRATLPGVDDPAAVTRYTLRLAKEDFKFAAAHFTMFPDGTGELLHGHNFRVRVALSGVAPDEMGLLADVAALKERIRAVCDGLDEHTLIPERSRLLSLRHEADSVEIAFGERTYQLPAADVTLLPIHNVTIETMAHLVWYRLAPSLAGGRIDRLTVEVEETAGQSCAYEAAIA